MSAWTGGCATRSSELRKIIDVLGLNCFPDGEQRVIHIPKAPLDTRTLRRLGEQTSPRVERPAQPRVARHVEGQMPVDQSDLLGVLGRREPHGLVGRPAVGTLVVRELDDRQPRFTRSDPMVPTFVGSGC